MQPHDTFASGEPHRDLKGRTIRGGALTVVSQITQFLVVTVSTVVLARLLTPSDFGQVGMVMAVTGFLGLVRDSGLSTATIQRETVTRELISTVFWVNVALGAIIALVCAALAPALVAFFREPVLFGITLALAPAMLIDAVGAQHMALLRRQMRLKAVAGIELLSTVVSVAVSIALAIAGFGLWALVSTRITSTLTLTLGAWILESWRPGLPRRGTGVGSMLRYGCHLTGVNLMTYSTRNVDNVLIGWFWGAPALGLYQKAYSLLMLPINQINAPMNGVAVATLSRIQSDPQRQRRYFVGAYTMAASIIIPIVVAATIFAEDIIRLVVGDQWIAAAGIFRYLAPAALIGALLSPLGWLFVSTGRANRQFRAGLVWTPMIILSFFLGLGYGPEGVAISFSVMSGLLALPLCMYAVHGTAVKLKDISGALMRPTLAGVVACAFGMLVLAILPQAWPVAVRAIVGGCAVVGAYALFLLVALRQWAPYRELVREVWPGRFVKKVARE